jgi:hypothetical protein
MLENNLPLHRDLDAYLECALRTSYTECGEYLDELDGLVMAEETILRMSKELTEFHDKVANDEYLCRHPEVVSRSLGYDFWLTRNGHGTGFWDGGYPETGDRLTEIAESFGSSELYVGEDNIVYIQ